MFHATTSANVNLISTIVFWIFSSPFLCVCVIFPVQSATLDSIPWWKRNGHASNDGDLNKNSKVINPQTNSDISCSFTSSSLDATCVLLSSLDVVNAWYVKKRHHLAVQANITLLWKRIFSISWTIFESLYFLQSTCLLNESSSTRLARYIYQPHLNENRVCMILSRPQNSIDFIIQWLDFSMSNILCWKHECLISFGFCCRGRFFSCWAFYIRVVWQQHWLSSLFLFRFSLAIGFWMTFTYRKQTQH